MNSAEEGTRNFLPQREVAAVNDNTGNRGDMMRMEVHLCGVRDKWCPSRNYLDAKRPIAPRIERTTERIISRDSTKAPW